MGLRLLWFVLLSEVRQVPGMSSNYFFYGSNLKFTVEVFYYKTAVIYRSVKCFFLLMIDQLLWSYSYKSAVTDLRFIAYRSVNVSFSELSYRSTVVELLL
jgi:hypothetical protein